MFFIDEGYKAEVIKSCLNLKSFNPHLILIKTENLTKFLKTEIGKNFIKAFNRLNSIVENTENNYELNQSLLKKRGN